MLGRENHLYLIGGRTPSGDSSAFWRFSLADRGWTKLADMPTARHSFASVIADDELWIFGGRSTVLGPNIHKTEIYSFQKGVWRQGPDLPVGCAGHVALYTGGQIHVIGGEAFKPNRLVERHDVYDLENGDWLQLQPPPKPRHGAAGVVLGHEILLFGGGSRPALATAFSASRSVQKFIPVRDVATESLGS